jgi:HTH-type transcriptional regulator/antitoxin HipB
MRIRTAAEVALLVREERTRQRISQDELAARAGVSRKWVSELESGKDTVELALALRALNALGIGFRVEVPKSESSLRAP